MSMPAIDWNDVWKQFRKNRQTSTQDPEFWNKRAAPFSLHASGSDYVRQFIDIMKPDPTWSVLGCSVVR